MSHISLDSIKETPKPLRRPSWIKVKNLGDQNETYKFLKGLMRSKSLHTVCEEARCPNIGECWGSRTATFLIMGDICTRSCRFCDVKTGRPLAMDWAEPERVAQAVKSMGLKHVVITSVNRDERDDGGAPIFAACVQRIRDVQPNCSIELLIPDFKGNQDALKIVMDARPEILNHNVETVERLFRTIQPQDKYEWARATLTNAKKMAPDGLTKSGLMVGLGETWDELLETMRDVHEWGVDILTIGQYLQPTRKHWPIERYYTPEEFAELKRLGYEMGFNWVESGPLVRSSYRASEQVEALFKMKEQLAAEESNKVN